MPLQDMSNKTESVVGVPLDEKNKDELKRRADEHGRSMGREAAVILKRTLKA